MPVNISIVIICKNAADTIGRAIETCRLVSDDVVAVDTGSTDDTVARIKNSGASLLQTAWLGYGETKELGNREARHDWILSLDSDEYLDDKCIAALRAFEPKDMAETGIFRRLNYLGDQPIRFGEWGNDMVTRLFNRSNAWWSKDAVHEALEFRQKPVYIRFKGTIHHRTSGSIGEQKVKLENYAALMAQRYKLSGKKPRWHKMYLSPAFSFVQNYIFKAGFLDGEAGLRLAIENARYNFRKYALLKH